MVNVTGTPIPSTRNTYPFPLSFSHSLIHPLPHYTLLIMTDRPTSPHSPTDEHEAKEITFQPDTPAPPRVSLPTTHPPHAGNSGQTVSQTVENRGNTTTSSAHTATRDGRADDNAVHANDPIRALSEMMQQYMTQMLTLLQQSQAQHAHPSTGQFTPAPQAPTSRLQYSAQDDNTQSILSPPPQPLFATNTPYRPFTSPDRRVQPVRPVEGSRDNGKLPDFRKFKGTDDDKIRARQWLRGADDYLRMGFANRSDADLVRLFGFLLEDSAQTWFYLTRDQKGDRWTLAEVYNAFEVQYAGEATNALLQAKLDGLSFSLKRDFTTFTSQWQDLVAQRFPREWAAGQGTDSELLGNLFSEKIKRDEVRVWIEAVRSQPRGLAEWKAAVQNAIAIIKLTEDAKAKSSYYSRQHGTTNAHVNSMEEGEDTQDYRAEGEAPHGEVNRAQVRQPTRGGPGNNSQKGGKMYSDAEWKKVIRLKLCSWCGRPGHFAQDCSDRKTGKDKTKATPEVLNA